MAVDSKARELLELEESITMIDTLLGGTEAMRRAGETYLPMFKAEVREEYNKRLSKATLLNVFKETIQNMAGRTFGGKFNTANVREPLADYLDDIDANGNDLQKFLEKTFYEALAYSRAYVVVDYSGAGDASTLSEEKAQGARPYAFNVSVTNVLEVRTEVIRGREEVTMFRYESIRTVEDPKDEFNLIEIPQIIVYTPGLVRIFEENDKGEWSVVDERELRINGVQLDYVPVVELKFARRPPLIDLAYLNVKHWQSQSDQDNILHTARVPSMFGRGTDFAEQEGVVFINGLIEIPHDAEIGYIEHTGAAIGAGQESLDDLVNQMEMQGAKMLQRNKIAMTEIQSKTEAKTQVSELMLYAMMLDNFADRVLNLYGLWLGMPEESYNLGIADSVNDNIDDSTSVAELVNAVNAEVVSRQTAFETLQARNVITRSHDWDEEKDRLSAENLTMDFSYEEEL